MKKNIVNDPEEKTGGQMHDNDKSQRDDENSKDNRTNQLNPCTEADQVCCKSVLLLYF